ncbi:MAG: YaiI/YqxD family protein [Syntrophomonadaceae bacterium]|nr:YaiI/YqxD family protein [Syntrophomonadaceae bacterium]
MKIVVDADACPVKGIIETVGERWGVGVVLVSNHHHRMQSDYASIVVVDGASQAADLAIMNMVCRGDLVVTQDYGLASMVMAKGSYALDPSGRVFNDDNIDRLLMNRYLSQKARRAGGRTRGPRKRRQLDNDRFAHSLERIVMENMDWPDGSGKS